MRRLSATFVCILVTAVLRVQGAPQNEAQSPRAIIDKYCVTCHNQRLKTAGLMLDKADLGNPAANAEVWEKALRKLRQREMPPPGRPRPDAETYNMLSAFLEKSLDDAASAHPNPGRVAVHRLNRLEYTNA